MTLIMKCASSLRNCNLHIRRLATLLVVFATVAALSPANAQARRRGSYNSTAMRQAQQQQMVQAARAQLDAAKQVLEAAESSGKDAQSTLDAAVAKLKEKSKEADEAKSATRELAKQLSKLEEDIVKEQPADSPYGRASAELEAAKKQLQDTEARVLAESDVQASLAGLTGADLTKRKNELLISRPDSYQAKTRLDAAHGEVERQRRDLLQNDKQWKDLSDELAKARKDERDANNQSRGSPRERTDATKKLQASSDAVAAAKAAIAQAEAVLRANGGSKYINSSSGNQQPKKKN
jgi:DNA repair exonuclease SbcCD ATPase subunit